MREGPRMKPLKSLAALALASSVSGDVPQGPVTLDPPSQERIISAPTAQDFLNRLPEVFRKQAAERELVIGIMNSTVSNLPKPLQEKVSADLIHTKAFLDASATTAPQLARLLSQLQQQIESKAPMRFEVSIGKSFTIEKDGVQYSPMNFTVTFHTPTGPRKISTDTLPPQTVLHSDIRAALSRAHDARK